MADRLVRVRLEEAQAQLKGVRAELAAPPPAGLADELAQVGLAHRTAREACLKARREKDERAQRLARLTEENEARSARLQAMQAQRSPGLITLTLTPVLLLAEGWLVVWLLEHHSVPGVAVAWASLLPAFLLGYVWRRRLTPTPEASRPKQLPR